MFRLLFYLLVGYIVWKIIQLIARATSAPPRDKQDVFTQKPQKKSETFKDVQDADFEDLPPDEKK